jgi:hypothetical protein
MLSDLDSQRRCLIISIMILMIEINLHMRLPSMANDTSDKRGRSTSLQNQRYFTIYNQHCTITDCKLTRLYETAQPSATELLKNMRKSRIYTGAL